MEIQQDFKDLLTLFNGHQVEYMVIGGYALAIHGAPRATGDMDLYVRPTPENAGRIMTVLKAFGFDLVGLETADFQIPGRIIQLGVPPVRIVLVTSIDGVDWDQAYSGIVMGPYGDIQVPYIGLDALRANKRVSGRKKDLADLEALGESETDAAS